MVDSKIMIHLSPILSRPFYNPLLPLTPQKKKREKLPLIPDPLLYLFPEEEILPADLMARDRILPLQVSIDRHRTDTHKLRQCFHVQYLPFKFFQHDSFPPCKALLKRCSGCAINHDPHPSLSNHLLMLDNFPPVKQPPQTRPSIEYSTLSSPRLKGGPAQRC